MGRHQFELATEADDAELRKVLSITPMPGAISVTFRREPSYFAAAVVDGTFHQVIACREVETQRIVGFGSRSVREMYVNAEPTPIGYLSTLRVLEQHRNIGLVARGYKYFRDLHTDGRAKMYLTTIAEGNDRAMSVLTSGRGGLPKYHAAGKYHTVAITVPRRLRKVRLGRHVSVRPALVGDTPVLLEFLEHLGPTRQFFPCYQSSDFFNSRGTFRDMKPSDLFLAFQDGRLVGTLGGWNQSAFRQTTVNTYAGPLRWARPVYNAWAGLRHRPQLPNPGEPFRYHIAALPVVESNDATIATALLDSLIAHLFRHDCDYLLLGLHESDPLLPLIKERGTATYITHLFYVCWDDGEALRNCLDEKSPYLELGCL